MGEAHGSSSQNILSFPANLLCWRWFLPSHVYVIAQEASWLSPSPSPSGSAVIGKKCWMREVKGDGRNEVKSWIKIQMGGQDSDAPSKKQLCFWEANLQLFSHPQTSNQLHEAEMDYYSLSIKCRIDNLLTKTTHIEHSDRKTTVLEKRGVIKIRA